MDTAQAPEKQDVVNQLTGGRHALTNIDLQSHVPILNSTIDELSITVQQLGFGLSESEMSVSPHIYIEFTGTTMGKTSRETRWCFSGRIEKSMVCGRPVTFPLSVY